MVELYFKLKIIFMCVAIGFIVVGAIIYWLLYIRGSK